MFLALIKYVSYSASSSVNHSLDEIMKTGHHKVMASGCLLQSKILYV